MIQDHGYEYYWMQRCKKRFEQHKYDHKNDVNEIGNSTGADSTDADSTGSDSTGYIQHWCCVALVLTPQILLAQVPTLFLAQTRKNSTDISAGSAVFCISGMIYEANISWSLDLWF